MRWIFEVVICVLMFSLSVQAEVSNGGYVRIINTVGVHKPLQVELNEKSLCDTGYESGIVTGGIWAPSGKLRVKMGVEGFDELNFTIQIKSGENLALIVYLQRRPKTTGDGFEWVLKCKEWSPYDPKEGKTISIVSLSCKDHQKISVGLVDRRWSHFSVDSMKVIRTELDWPNGYVPLLMNDEKQESIPVASDANYMVILYDQVGEGVKTLTYKDRLYGQVVDDTN